MQTSAKSPMTQETGPLQHPDAVEATFPNALTSKSEFRRHPTIGELARQQGVTPPICLDDLAGDWPEEDSIEEFLNHIRRDRA